MRGRLINPYTAEFAPIDREATADAPAGPAESGYDDVFREPALARQDADDRVGEPNRVEGALVRIPVQVEVRAFEDLVQMYGGSAPRTQIDLVAHFRDLERAGLVDADGLPTLGVGARLVALRRKRSGDLVQRFPDPPGAYVTHLAPGSFWRGGRNLLVITVQSRDRADPGLG